MQEDYPVPADGTIAYKYFEIPTHLTEDKWVQAIEVKPGNPAVVHHVIVYARAPRPAQAAAPSSAEARGPRPLPLFTYPDGTTDVPPGQTGGPPFRRISRSPTIVRRRGHWAARSAASRQVRRCACISRGRR